MSDAINIQFNELKFQSGNYFSRDKKEILKGVSGKFEAFNVTAILGPSGCGKTTLLNILSGYQRRNKNIQGSIQMNGLDISRYRNDIAYILQDNFIQPLLTVNESMDFALKLKTSATSTLRSKKINDILTNFGLADRKNVLVKNLSGGQLKRLAIAMEIVNDPLVIYLDEATTGLDSVNSTQVVKLLKQLANEGRTIVMTVHQPSGLLIRMFDHIYALANGSCVYQGSGENLIQFFKDVDHVCPPFYNPADFLLELVTGVYGDKNRNLIDKIENGRNESYRGEVNSVDRKLLKKDNDQSISNNHLKKTCTLLQKNLLISYRDKSFTYLRMFIHVAVGVLLGMIYYDIGNNANQILNNFRLMFVALSFLIYTSYYSIMMIFPLNFPCIRREVFNQWYKPIDWFLALVINDLPVLILADIAFIIPVYYMTSQPIELTRIGAFTLIMMLTSIVSQSFGLVCGSFVGVKGTLILAPVLMVFHGAFAGFYILKKDSHPFWHQFYEWSYVRFSAYGSEISVLGFNRTKMDCSDFYCHFRSPQKFLSSVGYDDVEFSTCVSMLVINFVIFIVMAFVLMQYRLKSK